MNRRHQNSNSGCGSADVSSSSLLAIVRAYRMRHRVRAIEEYESFRKEPSLLAAVERASLAQRPNGKRYDHQRRLSAATLDEVRRVLLSTPLDRCRSFQELHTAVRESISPIRGVGELMVYDTAVRIGAWLQLKPEHVYLHAGTREGARALGLRWREPFVVIESFAAPLQSLEPFEIEDCLCIYKEQLMQLTTA
jgi:hypothetical protein